MPTPAGHLHMPCFAAARALARVPILAMAGCQMVAVSDNFDRTEIDFPIYRMAAWQFVSLSKYPEARFELSNRHPPESGEPTDFVISATAEPSGRDVDTAERAELWESDSLWLPSGTEVWYGFSMWVDEIEPEEARLVIGQWKTSGGRSPFLAQRLSKGIFHITVEDGFTDQSGVDASQRVDLEQEDGAAPESCRVVIAVEAGATAPDYGACPHNVRLSGPDGAPIEAAAPIPVTPEGRWLDVMYGFRIDETDGWVEVWIDGRHIVTARGAIGHPNLGRGGGDRQLFKYGPYRNALPAEIAYPVTAKLNDFRRGPTREAVARSR